MLLLILLLLSSCTTFNPNVNPDIFYRRDIGLEVNGYKSSGTLVVPKANTYKINITALGKLDLLDFSTCHRSIIKEKAGNGIFNNNKASIDLTPINNIENDGNCDATIYGLNQKQRHSFGYLAFENEKYTLPATVKCNGNEYQSRGVTVCQAKAGLMQEIDFSENVAFVAENISTKDNRVITYNIKKGENVIVFKGKTSNKFHRLVTIGFEQVLLYE